MRVAVTGAGGRLGRALVTALEEAPFTGPFGPIAWTRPIFDLDAPDAFAALARPRPPEVVVHAAAWTDVDGCARDPELALARNGAATGVLAEAAAARGIDLIVVSTNEVFDGRRTDGTGYAPDDPTNPINPYGASKLAGEAGRAPPTAVRRRGPAPARRSGSSGRRGCSDRRATTSRPRSSPPPTGPRAAGEPLRARGRRARLADVRRTTWPRRSRS